MKTLYIVIGILLAIFLTIQVFAMRSQSNIETYPYSVIQIFEDFEIRRYEATLFTSVKMTTNDYKKASRTGFSRLAGYIFGGNERNEKIAMTSPVAMSIEDSMTMMFMVPKKMKLADLPKPNDRSIEFIEEPAKIVAAISFGGWANDKKIEKHKKKLIQALKDQGVQHKNAFYFLGYNPPFEVFNRRNELIVELTDTSFNALKDIKSFNK
jgi:hypothetical protein